MKQEIFSPRELKIIKLICKQYTTKEIARNLGLSFRTIEGYREIILTKTNAKNIAGVVLYAVRNKIIEV